MALKDTVERVGAWVIICTVIGVVLGLMYMVLREPTRPPAVPSEPAKALKSVPKEEVTISAPVKVYAKPAAKKLNLPKDVQTSTTERVLAATQVQPSDRRQTVTTTLDTATGESRQFVQADPFPWVALEHRGEVRLSGGYKFSQNYVTPKPVARLSVSYEAVRIKALTVGVVAQVDSDGDAFAGVGLAYRW